MNAACRKVIFDAIVSYQRQFGYNKGGLTPRERIQEVLGDSSKLVRLFNWRFTTEQLLYQCGVVITVGVIEDASDESWGYDYKTLELRGFFQLLLQDPAEIKEEDFL